MDVLLDTHAFLWWVEDTPTLSVAARRTIANPANECWLSLASCWEMAIKLSLRKLRLGAAIERFVPEHLAASGFRLLEIDFADVARVGSLTFHHRDPFDRLLVVQALRREMAIVSRDRTFERYGVERVW
jgi:PIN domain nuclease of toxin-antitoxin system